jgi:hypothetical protein
MSKEDIEALYDLAREELRQEKLPIEDISIQRRACSILARLEKISLTEAMKRIDLRS